MSRRQLHDREPRPQLPDPMAGVRDQIASIVSMPTVPSPVLDQLLAAMKPPALEQLVDSFSGGAVRDVVAAAMPRDRFATIGALSSLGPRWQEQIDSVVKIASGADAFRALQLDTIGMGTLTSGWKQTLDDVMGRNLAAESTAKALQPIQDVSATYRSMIAGLDPAPWITTAIAPFDPSEVYREALSTLTIQDAFARLGSSAVVAEKLGAALTDLDLTVDETTLATAVEQSVADAVPENAVLTERDRYAIGAYMAVLAFALLMWAYVAHPAMVGVVSQVGEIVTIASGVGTVTYKALGGRNAAENCALSAATAAIGHEGAKS
ncbi:hypothetical protein [Cellulosimicrobium cellulans]|uniref:hypothetical protein n=1 Tax=Cellulosimicrobium cellulans TaxID=1710 RepID=UPI00130EC9C4|nr:hypothetical protein [Cellulosimicrobium cellulans]